VSFLLSLCEVGCVSSSSYLLLPPLRGLQHLFFAERETSKIPGVTAAPATLNSAVVIGSGTMGTGIAICLIEGNISTLLFDLDRKSLQRAQETVKKTLFSQVEKGRITKEVAEKKFGLLTILGLGIGDNGKLEEGMFSHSFLSVPSYPFITQISLSLFTLSKEENKALSKVDLVIEAVFESMDLKKKIFSRLDRFCKKEAILASNTSTLNIDEIATATTRPQQGK
jgi:3-hydroxyacyl-CoA dehydrogenase